MFPCWWRVASLMRSYRPGTHGDASKLAWSNGYDVRLTRERFRVRSSVLVFRVVDTHSPRGQGTTSSHTLHIGIIGQRVRVVKETDSKSVGLCPRRFESCRCRFWPADRQKKGVKTISRREDRWSVRVSIVVSISACHADDPGSIPGRGTFRRVFQIKLRSNDQ